MDTNIGANSNLQIAHSLPVANVHGRAPLKFATNPQNCWPRLLAHPKSINAEAKTIPTRYVAYHKVAADSELIE